MPPKLLQLWEKFTVKITVITVIMVNWGQSYDASKWIKKNQLLQIYRNQQQIVIIIISKFWLLRQQLTRNWSLITYRLLSWWKSKTKTFFLFHSHSLVFVHSVRFWWHHSQKVFQCYTLLVFLVLLSRNIFSKRSQILGLQPWTYTTFSQDSRPPVRESWVEIRSPHGNLTKFILVWVFFNRGLLSFNKSEKVLWAIAKYYYYY